MFASAERKPVAMETQQACVKDGGLVTMRPIRKFPKKKGLCSRNWDARYIGINVGISRY